MLGGAVKKGRQRSSGVGSNSTAIRRSRGKREKPLGTIHYNSDAKLAEAKTRIADIIRLPGKSARKSGRWCGA